MCGLRPHREGVGVGLLCGKGNALMTPGRRTEIFVARVA